MPPSVAESSAARPFWRSRDAAYLLAIIAVAVTVRLWGIDFGLPNEHARPDERHLIGYTLTLGGNKLNPGFFNYPSLCLYLLFAVYGAYFVLGRLTGHFGSAQDLVAEYSIAPAPLFLLDRLLVVLLSTATVYLVYEVGKRAFGRRVGLLSALFLSLAYLHVRDSHFGTVDVPVTFFATLCIAKILKAQDIKTRRAFIVAGFIAGLAVSTKYNAIALVAPLGLLHLYRVRTEAWSRIAGDAALTLIALVIGFVVATPFSVLDPATFWRDVSFELLSKAGDLPKVDLGRGISYHLRFTLPHGLGWPLLFSAAVGAGAALKENWRQGLLLVAFPVAWWLGTGMSHYVYVRYTVPLAPMLCVLAAAGVEAAARAIDARLGPREGSPREGFIVAALAAVVLAAPFRNVVQWDRLVARTDTRVLVSRWVEQHIPKGASVGVVGPNYMRPQLWSTPEQLSKSEEAALSSGRRLRNALIKAHIERTGVSSFQTYAFEKGAWHDIVNDTEVLPGSPDCAILADHPVWMPEGGDLPTLGPEYELVATFLAFTAGGDAVFDWHDAFYFPFAGFDGIERPGPNLRVFRRLTPAATHPAGAAGGSQ
jgi:hypothetical protein